MYTCILTYSHILCTDDGRLFGTGASPRWSKKRHPMSILLTSDIKNPHHHSYHHHLTNSITITGANWTISHCLLYRSFLFNWREKRRSFANRLGLVRGREGQNIFCLGRCGTEYLLLAGGVVVVEPACTSTCTDLRSRVVIY